MDTNKAGQEFKRILSLTEKGRALAESSNLIQFSNTNPITDKIGIYVKLDGYFDQDELLELKRALDEVTALLTNAST